ncbi:RcpC/CpaB family pilus assembly protein [Georgenia sp. M64]|uniref:Flp pilus assembly protein CpaB n=1 Tax=Georgenia sp. M64 TaxID=3120520 RepID=UPI0030E2B3F3
MNRRLIAALVAVVLAGLGAVLLVSYVGASDERAVADLEPSTVLIATVDIPAGTTAEQLLEMTASSSVPGTAVAPGALTSIAEVDGELTTADIVAGEQLSAHRFAPPEDVVTAQADEVVVPAGMHEITIQLEPRRVIGGHLAAGETVAIFESFEIDEVQQTKLVLNKVLVTRVQGGVVEVTAPTDAAAVADTRAEEPAEPGTAVEAVPSEQIMVTLAVSAPDAEKVVFGSEWGSIWLSREPADAPTDGSRIVNGGNIYQ